MKHDFLYFSRFLMERKAIATLLIMAAAVGIAAYAQCPGCAHACRKSPQQWVESRVWSNGWNVDCHPSVNAEEFMRQYTHNREVWDAMFGFLASVDLDTLTIGRYDIVPDGRCYVKVSEYTPRAAEDVNIEQHHRTIDLQYTLSGNELMGYASGVTVKKEYNPTKDVAHFYADSVTYHPAEAGHFFLFFPCDYHQPSVRAVDNPGTSRKVVCKIEYLDF